MLKYAARRPGSDSSAGSESEMRSMGSDSGTLRWPELNDARLEGRESWYWGIGSSSSSSLVQRGVCQQVR